MKKILALLLILLVLTGCVDQKHNVYIYNNGKVAYRYELTVRKEDLKTLQLHGIDDYDNIINNPFILFEKVTKVYEEFDFKVENNQTDDEVVVIYSNTFKDYKEFQKVLTKLNEADVNGYVPNVNIKNKFYKKEIKENGVLRYHIDETTKEMFKDQDVEDLIKTLKASVTIQFQSGEFAHDGGLESDATVTFVSDADLESDTHRNVRIYTEIKDYKILALGGVVGILIVLVVIKEIKDRRG